MYSVGGGGGGYRMVRLQLPFVWEWGELLLQSQSALLFLDDTYVWIVCCSVSADQRKRTTTTTCPRVNPGLGRHFQVTNRFNYTFALFMCMHIHILEISSRRAGWIEVQQNKTPFCQHHSFIFSVYTVYSFFGNINWYYFDTAIRNSVSNSSYTSFTISLPITVHCLLIHIPLSFE